MPRSASESEKHFCHTVISICARPGMYTGSSSVKEVVYFLSGMHHGLFPSLRDGPMIEFKAKVLDPQNKSSNLSWIAVIEAYYRSIEDPKDWLDQLKTDFQAFCVDVYGESFGDQIP